MLFPPSLRQTRKERWLSERPAVFRLQAEVRFICETRESISHRLGQTGVKRWSERLEGKQQSFTKSRGHEKTNTWQSSKERMEEAIKYFILERMLGCQYYVWGKIGGPYNWKIFNLDIGQDVFSSQRIFHLEDTMKYVLFSSRDPQHWLEPIKVQVLFSHFDYFIFLTLAVLI